MLDLFMALWFLVMGIVFLQKTKSLQKWLADFYERTPAAKSWEGFFHWAQSHGFTLVARFFGILCFLNFFLFVYILIQTDAPLPVSNDF